MKRRMNLDSLAKAARELPLFRNDADSGIFAEHLVRATLQQVFRHEFKDTKWASGQLITIASGIAPGAKSYLYNEIAGTGKAEIVADNATDIPTADITGDETVAPIKTIAVSIRYSRQDVRAAQMQGTFDIVAEKSLSAREAMDRALDDLIRMGDASAGLRGVVNHPGILVRSAGVGNWAAGATAQQIIQDVTDAVNEIANASDGVEIPDTVVLPLREWTLLSTKEKSADSDMTVLEYLRRALPFITTWTWDHGLKSAGASGGPAMLVYRNAPSRLRAIVPLLMAPTPPIQRGLNFEVAFETRFGGVAMPRPRSFLRLEGI